jgi:Leucine-rich repeat (LRR) protein
MESANIDSAMITANGNQTLPIDVDDKIFFEKKLGVLGFLDNSGYELPEEVLMNIYRGLSIEDLFKLSKLSNNRYFKYIVKDRDIKLDKDYSMKYMLFPSFKDTISSAKTISLDIDIKAKDIKKYSSDWTDKPDNVVDVKIDSTQGINITKFLTFFNFRNFKNLNKLILYRVILDTQLIEIITSFPLLTALELVYISGDFRLLTQLDTLPNLVYLKISHAGLNDLSPLENLRNLTHLDLNNNKISYGIISVRNLTNLTYLDLSYNYISNIMPVQNLTNLTWLKLQVNIIKNITPLQNLTNLTHLYLHDNQIYHISPLQDLSNLTQLNLRHTKIDDINPLEKLSNLTYLNLQSTEIYDLKPLQKLRNLRCLNLESTKIYNLKPLENLSNLTYLNLQSTKIYDVTPLQGLTLLTQLGLKNTDTNLVSLDDIKLYHKWLKNTDTKPTLNSVKLYNKWLIKQ